MLDVCPGQASLLPVLPRCESLCHMLLLSHASAVTAPTCSARLLLSVRNFFDEKSNEPRRQCGGVDPRNPALCVPAWERQQWTAGLAQPRKAMRARCPRP